MSDYVNHDMQLAPMDDFDMQLASDTDFDWSSLNEEVMQEPWMDDFDWNEYYGQGTDAVAPGVGPSKSEAHFRRECSGSMAATPSSGVSNTTQSHESTPKHGDRNIAPRAHKRSFTCDSQGCESKTFSSKGDLNRHQKAHDTKIWYSCAAKDCLRKGKKGFYRKDKLLDHIIAAHDNDTLFACSGDHYLRGKCGGLLFTRDVMAIHASDIYGVLCRLNRYRDCPLPKCPYRFYLDLNGTSMDAFQAHLINKHDAKGRQNFTGRIQERGYDAATGEIICPVCLGEARFADHSSFYHHFFVAHFDGPAIDIDASVYISPYFGDTWSSRRPLGSCSFVSDEVRQCRRTILSLWPDFDAYPVWEDVE